MATSRYENIPIRKIKGRDTITPTDADINRKIPWNKIQMHIIKYNGEPLDQLAYDYWGEHEYFWVIMLANNLSSCWRITPGSYLAIPKSIKDVLEYF